MPIKRHLRENAHHLIILASITIALVVPLFFMEQELTGFAVFQETDFLFEQGKYTSSIIDAGEETEWDNISWTATELGELISNQDTILLYHMNEESGWIADLSGNNNTGKVIGNAQYSKEGKLNSALEFNGNDSYLDAGNNSALMPKQLTISVWTKIKELPGKNEQPSIISKGGGKSIEGYEVYIQNKTEPNRICFEIGKKTACSKETTEPNNWYHIAGTYDGTIMSIYINGELQNSTISSLTPDNIPLYIGKRQGKEKSFFKGAMDEIAILNRALDEQEVKALYKRGILSMNISVRSCDSPECDNSSWLLVNGSSPQTLAIPNSRYFQYKIESATEDPEYWLDIYNLTVSYNPVLPKQAPEGTILGNVSGISNLSIQTGINTINTSGMQEITLYNKNIPLTSFSHNFSEGNLNLTEIKINKTQDYIILNMRQNTKTIYLENNNFRNLCLKDADIGSIDEMSAECAEADETDLTECLGKKGTTIGNYHCLDDNGTIEVQNVSHSALRGKQGENPATEQTGTSSSGGGRSARGSNSQAKKEEALAETPAEKDREKQLTKQEEAHESKVRLEGKTGPEYHIEEKTQASTIRKNLLATAAILLLAGVSGIALLNRRRV